MSPYPNPFPKSESSPTRQSGRSVQLERSTSVAIKDVLKTPPRTRMSLRPKAHCNPVSPFMEGGGGGLTKTRS